MTLIVKSSRWIKRLPFYKNTSYRVERRSFTARPKVNIFDHRAIQFPDQQIGRCSQTHILRHRGIQCRITSLYCRIGLADIIDTFFIQQIKAKTQIDHCSKHSRLEDWLFFLRPTLLLLLSKMQCPLKVILPEIHPMPQPIIIVFAGVQHGLTINNSVPHRFVTPVKTNEQTGSSAIHILRFTRFS